MMRSARRRWAAGNDSTPHPAHLEVSQISKDPALPPRIYPKGRWYYLVTAEGKKRGSTGAKILIGWTPRLQAVIKRIKAIERKNLKWVITTQDAQPYTYYGASTAWRRSIRRAGVHNCHFNDLRAKALTDKEAAEGMQQATRMGAHSTEAQTADYVRHRKA